jgi:hypothetical protein
MPHSPKGRAVARGLDARLHLQHAFMPAGYASLKTAQVNQKCRLTVITVSTATGYCDAAILPILVAKRTLRADDHPPQIHVKRCVTRHLSVSVVDYTG